MSSRCEAFPFLIAYLDATKCVLLSIFTLTETNCQKSWEKLLPSNTKRPFPVDMHRSKTSLLKFLIETPAQPLPYPHFPICSLRKASKRSWILIYFEPSSYVADHGYPGQRETVKTCEELHFDSILVWKENELLFKGKCINSSLCNSTYLSKCFGRDWNYILATLEVILYHFQGISGYNIFSLGLGPHLDIL